MVQFLSLGTVLDIAHEFKDRTCISLEQKYAIGLLFPFRAEFYSFFFSF
jgi:hypothetical protein